MLKLSNVKVMSFDIDHLDIFWDVKPFFEDALTYHFTVLRSDNELGPYASISGEIIDLYHYKDTSVRTRRSQYHRIYYKIRVTNRSTGDTAEYPDTGGVCLAARPNLYAFEAARLERIRLREVEGRVLYLFKRRRTGQRCSVCYDAVTKRRLRSRCLTCYDTGFVGGYYAPILVYGQITTPEQATTHGRSGNIELQNSGLKMSNFPELDEGDLVVETENERWRIGQMIRKIKLHRALVRQQCPLHRIPNTDTEFSVPVNLDSEELRALEGTPHWSYTNYSEPDGRNLMTALSDVFGSKL